MSPKYISPISAALALAALSGTASAFIYEEINQVEGSVAFTNSLALAGTLSSVSIGSSSVGLSPNVGASTSSTFVGNSADYDISVVAHDVQHVISPTAYLDGGEDYYNFTPQTSAAVPNEPGTAPEVHFSECAGFASFQFVHAVTGDPIALVDAYAYAHPETSPGSFGGWQAHTNHQEWLGPTTGETFPVRGDGSNYRIDITYKVGLFWFPHSEERVIDCDQPSAPIIIELNPEELPFEPGAIEGYVDLKFLSEQPNTDMWAVSGPAGHQNYDALSTPAYGTFLIEDLIPSDWVNPSDPYAVYGNMHFNTGVNHEYFTTKAIEVTVPDGTTVSTGNAFVMDPGFVEGKVAVRGPRRCTTAADRVNRGLSGTAGGSASGDLTYSVGVDPLAEPGMRQLAADYLLAVGAPNNTTESWTPSYYGHFGTTSSGYQNSDYSYTDYTVGSPAVAPGAPPLEIDVNHCLAYIDGDIHINRLDASGSKFNNPRVWYNGSNSGDGVSYGVSGYATGVPVDGAARDVQGNVSICVPDGTYTFSANVTAESEAHVVSDTQVRQVTHDIQCGAYVNPLVVNVDVDSACAGELTTPMEVSAKGILEPTDVISMYAVLNCVDPDPNDETDIFDLVTDITVCPDRIEICGTPGTPACGVDPTHSIPLGTADLKQCGNTVHVVAIDADENEASVSASTPFSYELPATPGPGCNNVSVAYDNVKGGGTIDVDDIVEPMNNCGLELESTWCKFYNKTHGTTYSEHGEDVTLKGGTFSGLCRVQTECGNWHVCSFKADVTTGASAQ
jgi:hypothetical protein